MVVAYFAILSGKANAYCIGNDKELPGYDPEYYSVSHEFSRSKYVVRATALRAIWLGYDGKEKPLQPPFHSRTAKPMGLDPYVGAYYDVKVLQVFKGNPKPELRLFSENSTGRFSLNVGSDYILFISEDTFDRPIGVQLTVDNCGNSAAISNARTTLHSLQRLSGGN